MSRASPTYSLPSSFLTTFVPNAKEPSEQSPPPSPSSCSSSSPTWSITSASMAVSGDSPQVSFPPPSPPQSLPPVLLLILPIVFIWVPEAKDVDLGHVGGRHYVAIFRSNLIFFICQDSSRRRTPSSTPTSPCRTVASRVPSSHPAGYR